MLSDRFWDKVDKNGPIPEHRPDLGPCWIWTACKNGRHGYGQFAIGNGLRRGAHRLSFEDAKGPIPKGLVPDHLCRVRSCVNPSHIEAVTVRENSKRGIVGAKRFCVRGHLLEGDNVWLGRNGAQRKCKLCHAIRQRESVKTPSQIENKSKYMTEYRRKHRSRLSVYHRNWYEKQKNAIG